MDMLIKEFYVSKGDMQSFLEAEKFRLNSCAQFPHTLPPDMDNFLLEEIIPAFERALREPVDLRLLRVPFTNFALNASYTMLSDEACYKIGVFAPEKTDKLVCHGLVEALKCTLVNHGFEEIDKK